MSACMHVWVCAVSVARYIMFLVSLAMRLAYDDCLVRSTFHIAQTPPCVQQACEWSLRTVSWRASRIVRTLLISGDLWNSLTRLNTRSSCRLENRGRKIAKQERRQVNAHQTLVRSLAGFSRSSCICKTEGKYCKMLDSRWSDLTRWTTWRRKEATVAKFTSLDVLYHRRSLRQTRQVAFRSRLSAVVAIFHARSEQPGLARFCDF